MRILHAMLSRGLGGIEEAFLRYTQVLLSHGHEVICAVDPDAVIRSRLPDKAQVMTLRQWSEFDIFAAARIRKSIRDIGPNLILSHGARANRLMQRAGASQVPHVTVLHRYRFKKLAKNTQVICVTKRLLEAAKAHGVKPERLMHIPNFITAPEGKAPLDAYRSPPVIGCLGRFVPEKGIDLLIEALAILKKRGVPFQAIIGGDGPEKLDLLALTAHHHLNEQITFCGWVKDARAFYDSIDMLCVPSRSESFGLIIPEAWNQGIPVISTQTEGPGELISHLQDGLLCDANEEAIADALEGLLSKHGLAQGLAQMGKKSVQRYRVEQVGPRINAFLANVSSAARESA